MRLPAVAVVDPRSTRNIAVHGFLCVEAIRDECTNKKKCITF